MFHAVRRGWFHGIFLSRKTALLAIDGYKNPKYQQFFKRKSATEYVFGTCAECTPGYPIVHTDGSYRYNTKRAGFGVYFGEHDHRNSSGFLPGVRGSLNAEAVAATIALLRSQGDLEIRTDCLHLILMVVVHSNAFLAPHRSLFQLIRHLSTGRRIKWTHVPAHKGIAGNEAADALARWGSASPCIKEPWWRPKTAKIERPVFSLDLKTYLEALLLTVSVCRYMSSSCLNYSNCGRAFAPFQTTTTSCHSWWNFYT